MNRIFSYFWMAFAVALAFGLGEPNLEAVLVLLALILAHLYLLHAQVEDLASKFTLSKES